jgi:hypothetical protein
METGKLNYSRLCLCRMTFLLICFGVFAAAIIGIIYFHTTGQAKWAPHDKAETLGWLARLIQQSIFHLPIFFAYWFVFGEMKFFIPASWPKETPSVLFLFGCICVFCSILKIEESILQKLTFWKYLSLLAKRGKHFEKKRSQKTKKRIREYFHKP